MARLAYSVALLAQPELRRTGADVPKMFPLSNSHPVDYPPVDRLMPDRSITEIDPVRSWSAASSCVGGRRAHARLFRVLTDLRLGDSLTSLGGALERH
jgi:hypothetical protein